MHDEPATPLAALIGRACELQGVTTIRGLAAIAQNQGLPVSMTSLVRMTSPHYRGQPRTATLRSIARLAGTTLPTVQRAAGIEPQPEPLPREEQVPGYRTLTAAQKRQVKALVRCLQAANEAGGNRVTEPRSLEEMIGMIALQIHDSPTTGTRRSLATVITQGHQMWADQHRPEHPLSERAYGHASPSRHQPTLGRS